MSKVRLIIVQGPAQLLNVLSVLRSQEADGEYRNCDDFLILGGYSDQKLNQVCLQISQVWNFKERLLFYEFEKYFYSNSCDFLAAAQLLKEHLNILSADVVYTCRNWQFVNEVFLAAYPNARKICYGDGLGWLDLNSTAFVSKPLNPSGFIPIDDAYLIVPVDDKNSFDLCKVRQVDPQFFASIVADSAKQIKGLSDYCKSIATSFGDSVTIALTSYETEAGFIKDYQDEINSYLLSVLPSTQPNETVLVKGHPRQQLNQAQILVRELCKHKRNALAVPEIWTRIPIELFSSFLHIEKAFTFSSYSCVSIAYLCQSELIIGYGEKTIKKSFIKENQEYRLTSEHLLALLGKQAYSRKFEPIRYLEIEKQIAQFHQVPIYLQGSSPMQYQIQAKVTEQDIIQSFHTLYYDAAQQRGLTWQKTYWMGTAIYKCPLDLWIYQEILFEIKPELIIECGTLYGGSALFLAQMCDLLGQGEIVSIDIQDRPNRPQHPRISYWLGSSTSEQMVERVKQKASDKASVLVILDSDHRADHVLQELRLYSDLVTQGSYVIVEDTNINGHPVYSDYGPGPMEAVQAFMGENPPFYVDRECEKLYLTFNPSGYLKKRNFEEATGSLALFSIDIEQYQKDPDNPLAIATLRDVRHQIATQWLSLSDSQLEVMYIGEVGRTHQALLNSGMRNESLTATEQSFVDEVVTHISRGFDQPKALQYLLAAMLYRRADQLPLQQDFDRIPPWLLNDYLKFLFASPPNFQEVGEANNYYHYMQSWIDYLHTSILNEPDSLLWHEVVTQFVPIANFIPLYFNEINLKDIYLKRAEIIEFFLKLKGYEVDYEFADRSVTRKKIRLGILAAHFTPTAETFATLSAYEYISRDFEVILYPLTWTNTSLEQYCQSCANSVKLLPKDLVDQVNSIRADDLDILLIATNVTAVTNQICLLSLHRLARVQVTSVSSVVTTGMRHVDYYISGKLTDALITAEEHYIEKLVKLEGTAQCFSYGHEQQQVNIKVDRESLGISEEAVVFTSGANFFKITPELIDTWAKIIAAVPNSVLLLLPFGPNWSNVYPKKAFFKHIKTKFEAHGVAADCLMILDPQPVPNLEEVKEYFKIADIYLDSYPFSGTSSLIEPLDVGLPIIARQGSCFRSAMGAAILQALGVPDLVADSEESYIQSAIALGKNPELRQDKSKQIQQKMQSNPSFLDSRAYSAQMGSLFQELFRNYLAETISNNLNFREINLIIFPDWNQPEELLCQNLASVISAIASHPQKSQITLLIDTSNLADPNYANLALSTVAMNLLMEEDVDVAEGLEISLLENLGQLEWKALLTKVDGRVALEQENPSAIARIKAENLPLVEIDNLKI